MSLAEIFVIFLKHLLILLFCLNPTSAHYAQYQFNLPIEINALCPRNGYRCKDNKIHFLCPARNLTPCQPFQDIPVTGELQRSFVLGHNGIRNKVAEDWGIANMNLVHWSRPLQKVASTYLQLCKLNADKCLNIGEYYLPINQNYIIRRHLAQRWPDNVVRSWYTEISYDVQSFQKFLEYRKTHNVRNFTQMLWPKLEFVGCAAALIKNSYYHIVCYYYPSVRGKNITKALKFGKPCTKCMFNRNACSYTFYGLCGIDVELPNSSPRQLSEIHYIILVFCLLFFANKFYLK